MTHKLSKPVMDIAPWPHGLGFNDAASWWAYVHQQSESEKIDLLLSMALLSSAVCDLLLKGERALFDTFQFSEATIVLLSSIQASTLPAFAEALLFKNNPTHPGEDNACTRSTAGPNQP